MSLPTENSSKTQPSIHCSIKSPQWHPSNWQTQSLTAALWQQRATLWCWIMFWHSRDKVSVPGAPGQLREEGKGRGLKKNILIIPQEEFLVIWPTGAHELNGKVKERGSNAGLEQVERVIMILGVIREFIFGVKTAPRTFFPLSSCFVFLYCYCLLLLLVFCNKDYTRFAFRCCNFFF